MPYSLGKIPIDFGSLHTALDITPTFLLGGLGFATYFILLDFLPGVSSFSADV
jgi:hypothetical protein